MKKLFICFIIIGVAACRKSVDPNPKDLSVRELALISIGQNTATTGLVDFQTSVNNLRASISSYTNDPGSANKLYQLQTLYLWTAFSWKQVATFTFGPFDQRFVSTNVYGPVDTTSIEGVISKKGNIIDSTYLSTLGPGYKGLVAIEYLIFGINRLDNREVLAAFSGENNQRIEYLRSLGKDLQRNADFMAVEWSRGGKGYVATFASATGNDRNSSMALLVDGMVGQLSKLIDESIGLPMGIRHQGVPQPNLVDGRYSNKSIDLLNAEIKGIAKIILGLYSPGIQDVQGIGLNQELDAVNARYGDMKLTNAISLQIINIEKSATAIGLPLSEAVVSKKQEVSSLYSELSKLRTLIDVEVRRGLNLE